MNFNAIKELINPKTVIDVGANTGWFAQNLRQVCPMVDITMIEANPNCEDKLDKIGYSYAIGNNNYTSLIYVNGEWLYTGGQRAE